MKRRKLSTARSRTELIASHAYGHKDALAVPPPPPDASEKPPAETEKPPADTDTNSADATVTTAIASIKAAVDKAIEAQQADPDAGTDPKDQKVMDDLSSLSDAVATLMKDQAADAGEPADTTTPDKPAAPEKEPPATTAAGTVPAQPKPTDGGDTPNANPVNDSGGVDDGVVCATPDCGHLASAHTNTSTGDNTGACSMLNCSCEAMNVEADPTSAVEDDDDADESGDGPAPKKPLTLAAPVVDAPIPAAPAGSDAKAPDLNPPPATEGGANMGPAFTVPVAIIEGQPTGDGRQIAAGALTWRVPPLPLMGLATETHDPEGWDLNDPSVICGRIDSFERVPGESGTQLIVAKGFYLPNDDGMYFADLTQAMGRCGISADVAVQASEIEVGDVDPDGWPLEMSEILTEGTIMGLTQCPFPAFEGAYIVLGDGTEQPDATAIPQQSEDEPMTPPKPPAAVTAGGQLVHFMSYEECAACDQGFEVIVAAGGPTRPPKAWFANPHFTEDDGRLVEILDRRGKRAMGGKYACPLTVTDDGRVYGHIAPWDVCHTGVSGQCVLAPKSAVDYAHFKRGQHIVTAEGDQIRVGVITCDTGHAATRGISAASAMAHYDNTALAAADVNIGDDEYGIWVAGALRPDATEEQVRKLRAASISGDWRNMGGRLELVAALAVNQPGFPLAVVADGRVESLVAAGASVMHRVKHPAEADQPADTSASLLKALSGLLPVAARSARDRIEAHR